jgi:hypothetical protein
MKVTSKKIDVSQIQISVSDFLKSYNKNIPAGFPHASLTLLEKFKSENPLFFKHGDMWSLDEHRKKVMDWFQLLKSD